MTEDELVQAGWRQVPPAPFTAHVGPFYIRGEAGARELAFVGRAEHGNHIGVVNGGMVATFADVALGFCVVEALGAPRCATVQLQLHYVSAAPMGLPITCKPELVRRTAQLVFVRGLICAAEKVVANADGIWKVFEAPK